MRRQMNKKFRLILSNHIFRFCLIISIAGVLAAIVLLVVGYIFVGKTIATRGQILDLSSPVTGKRYYRLTEDYNTTKEERARLAQVRPSIQEMAVFVQTLDDLAARTGVAQTVEAGSGGDAEQSFGYSVPAVRYQLNVAGSLPAVQNYLHELNKVPYLLRFVSVKITAAPEKPLAESALGVVLIDIASK